MQKQAVFGRKSSWILGAASTQRDPSKALCGQANSTLPSLRFPLAFSTRRLHAWAELFSPAGRYSRACELLTAGQGASQLAVSSRARPVPEQGQVFIDFYKAGGEPGNEPCFKRSRRPAGCVSKPSAACRLHKSPVSLSHILLLAIWGWQTSHLKPLNGTTTSRLQAAEWSWLSGARSLKTGLHGTAFWGGGGLKASLKRGCCCGASSIPNSRLPTFVRAASQPVPTSTPRPVAMVQGLVGA